MKRFVVSCSILLVGMLVAAEKVDAALYLMSTDYASFTNNARATTLGHTVTTNSITGIVGTSVGVLSTYDVIWINPAFGTYTDLQTGVAPAGSLEQYVAGGGTLVVHAGGNSISPTDIAPGGVDYLRYGLGSSLHQSETFASPTHPYLTGAGYGGTPLVLNDFVNWNLTDHGHLAGLVGGTTTILSNTDGPSLIEYQYGLGTVLVSTLTYGWGSSGANGPALDNLLNYAAFIAGPNAVVPEPSSLALLGLGAVGFGAMTRRRYRKQS